MQAAGDIAFRIASPMANLRGQPAVAVALEQMLD
jgi:hypothetical protein